MLKKYFYCYKVQIFILNTHKWMKDVLGYYCISRSVSVSS